MLPLIEIEAVDSGSDCSVRRGVDKPQSDQVGLYNGCYSRTLTTTRSALANIQSNLFDIALDHLSKCSALERNNLNSESGLGRRLGRPVERMVRDEDRKPMPKLTQEKNPRQAYPWWDIEHPIAGIDASPTQKYFLNLVHLHRTTGVPLG
ncbi:MAG: hypothetical protein WB630_20655 [Candidatus Acidiferrales bacterium]